MPDEKPNSEASAQGSGRKTRPPVIELTATDVTPEESAAKSEEKPESPRAAENPQPRETTRPSLLTPILAGAGGLLAGALLLALVVLFSGDRVSKLFASAAEMVSGPKAASDLAALRDQSAILTKQQEETGKQIAELSGQVKNIDVAAMKSRLETLEAGTKNLQDALTQEKDAAAKARDALDERLAALEARAKQQAARPAAANAAEVVALGALSDAIAKGASFTKELDVVRAMLGDAGATLAPLAPSAATGLPTVGDLRRRFAELAPKLAHEPQTDAGYLSRLLSSASRLVEVRPVGEVPGTSAGAVVARIETRLARNDLAAALDEAAQLPPAAKSQATEWIASASKRREADAVVKNLLSAALSSSAEPLK